MEKRKRLCTIYFSRFSINISFYTTPVFSLDDHGILSSWPSPRNFQIIVLFMTDNAASVLLMGKRLEE